MAFSWEARNFGLTALKLFETIVKLVRALTSHHIMHIFVFGILRCARSALRFRANQLNNGLSLSAHKSKLRVNNTPLGIFIKLSSNQLQKFSNIRLSVIPLF